MVAKKSIFPVFISEVEKKQGQGNQCRTPGVNLKNLLE